MPTAQRVSSTRRFGRLRLARKVRRPECRGARRGADLRGISGGTESNPADVVRALIAAQERRTERLATLLDGARLRGLEQLYEYLHAAEHAYRDLPAIANLAFLVYVHAVFLTEPRSGERASIAQLPAALVSDQHRQTPSQRTCAHLCHPRPANRCGSDRRCIISGDEPDQW